MCKCLEYHSSDLLNDRSLLMAGFGFSQYKEEGKRVPEHMYDISGEQECFCYICTNCPIHNLREV